MKGDRNNVCRAHRPFAFDSRQAEAIFRASLTPTLIVNHAGDILDANGAASEDLGYSRTEFVRMRWQEFTHPDDIGDDEAETERARESDRDGEQYRMTKRYRPKGQSRWVWRELVVTTYTDPDSGDFFMFVSQIAPLSAGQGSGDGIHAMIEEAVATAMTKIVGQQLVSLMDFKEKAIPVAVDPVEVKVRPGDAPPLWVQKWWPQIKWGLGVLAAIILGAYAIGQWKAGVERQSQPASVE